MQKCYYLIAWLQRTNVREWPGSDEPDYVVIPCVKSKISVGWLKRICYNRLTAVSLDINSVTHMSHVTLLSRDVLDPLLIQKYFSLDQADNRIIKCAFPHYSNASRRELRRLKNDNRLSQYIVHKLWTLQLKFSIWCWLDIGNSQSGCAKLTKTFKF